MPVTEGVSPSQPVAVMPTDTQFLDALASMLQGAFQQMGQQLGQQLTTAMAMHDNTIT